MKLKELQTKYKSKFAIRALAGVLTIALLGSSAGVYRVCTAKAETKADVETAADTKDAVTETKEKSVETELSSILNSKSGKDDTTKDETVYVISDAKGASQKTIVEEWLKNPKGTDTIDDVSDLSDITNIKGDETFTQDGDKLVWQAGGKDIYYQGNSDKQVPVSEQITYYLDGKEIEPEDLAGKSGKVTIRFDYTNNEKKTVNVDGKDIEVNVPFTVMTGMVLSDDFTNIEVTNGKVVSDGKNNVIVGIAMPGLKDSLGVSEEDFDEDIDFPDYVEVTADVTDFELEMTASVAMSSLLSDFNLNNMDLSDLEDSIEELSDGANQLEDGSGELSDGLDTLKDNMGSFATGVSQLKDGINDYTDGTSQLDSGLNTLNSKVGSLSSGATKLDSSASTIANGVNTLDKALNTDMTDAEKTKVKSTVDAQFAEGSTTYKYIYNSAVSNFSSTMKSDATVSSIQSGIASTGLTSDGVIAALADYYATNGFTDPTSGKTYSATACKATVPGTTSTYAVYFASAVLKGGLASGIATGIATQGSSAVGTSVVSACKTVAEGAAVSGAEGAKESIAQQIEAVDSTSGYSLVSGTAALSKGISTLADSVPALVSGVSQLTSGADKLVANNKKLNSGVGTLADGTTKIVNGVDKLDSGAKELHDGMVTFNKQGIQKLTDAYNGNAKDLLDRLDAVVKAGNEYNSFTGLADSAKGSVKFIIKTDSIKSDDSDSKED